MDRPGGLIVSVAWLLNRRWQVSAAIDVRLPILRTQLREVVCAGTDRELESWLLSSDQRVMKLFGDYDAEEPVLASLLIDVNARLMRECIWDADTEMRREELSAQLQKLGQECAEHICALSVPLGFVAPEERQTIVATLVSRLEVEFEQVMVREIDFAKTFDRVITNSIKPLVLKISEKKRSAMTWADLQLLKLLGSVNGEFQPQHLASVLFCEEHSANSDSAMGILVDVSKSVRDQAVSSVLGTIKHSAIIEAIGEDELSATIESVPFLMWAQVKFTNIYQISVRAGSAMTAAISIRPRPLSIRPRPY